MFRVSKKIKRRIIGVGAAGLAIVIASGAIISSTQTAEAARASLPGIEETIAGNNNSKPFRILEVVPDKEDATLGLLIGGEEPIDKSAKSIKDMPSKEERGMRFEDSTLDVKADKLHLNLTAGKVLNYTGYAEYNTKTDVGEPYNTVDIRGTFVEADNGDYGEKATEKLYVHLPKIIDETDNDPIPENAEHMNELSEINASGLSLYRKHYSYRPGDANETYLITLEEIPEEKLDSFMPIQLDNGIIMDNEENDDAYNNQYFTVREVIGKNTVLKENDMIFQIIETPVETGNAGEEGGENEGEAGEGVGEGEGTGEEAGNGDKNGENAGNENEDDSVKISYKFVTFVGEDEEDILNNYADGSNYVIMDEADGSDIEDGISYYAISSVKNVSEDNNKGLSRVEEYVIMTRPEGGYVEPVTTEEETERKYIGKHFYIFTDELKFEYITGSKDAYVIKYNFITDFTQAIYEEVRYTKGITNYELFKQYVFDLTTEDEYENMYIDVVTVTYQDLADKLEENNNYLTGFDMLYFGGCICGMDDEGVVAHPDSTPEDQKVVNNADFNATRILFEAVQSGKPTVMNRSVYEAKNNSLLVRTFAAAVMQRNIQGVNSATYFPQNAKDVPNAGVTFQNNFAILEDTMVKPLADGSLTYVRENLYVHDDVYVDKNYVVNEEFATKQFKKEQIDGRTYEDVEFGFKELLDEIETENFYLQNAGVPENNRIKSEATVATAIRHIINYGNRRNTTKSKIRVLDLEPADFEAYYTDDKLNRDDDEGGNEVLDVYEDIHVKDANPGDAIYVNEVASDSFTIVDGELKKYDWLVEHLTPQFESNPNDGLEVEIMGTREFIGTIEDLNETYDLIYIGMDTSIMNTEIEGDEGGNKTNKTIYNDEDLNGLVYSHIGDTFKVDNDNNTLDNVYRGSGNDITPDKKRELTEYVQAGYALLLSDEFFVVKNGEWDVNADKVHEESYMYDFVKNVVLSKENGEYKYFGKNVNKKANIDGGENGAPDPDAVSEFTRYLGISKLRLDPKELPLEWSDKDDDPDDGQNYEPQYLTKNEYGVYELEYEIELINDAAVGTAKSTYNCELYVDVDADGRYEEQEKLTGLTILDEDGDSRSVNDDGEFTLEADEVYSISRELPDTYSGFISWKIVFTQNDTTFDFEIEDETTIQDSMVRCSLVGYSAVPAAEDKKPTIKVLQIYSADDVDNLNLDSQQMHDLYANVQDFNLEITRISADRYVDMNTNNNNGWALGSLADYTNDDIRPTAEQDYIDYLNQFDMLVMGFDDEFLIGNVIGQPKHGNAADPVTQEDVIESILAIREYILSGKSVLLTHDLSSQRVANPNGNAGYKAKGWYVNRLLRDVMGMDRYAWVDLKLDDYAAFENYVYEFRNAYDENEVKSRYYYDTVYDNRLSEDYYEDTYNELIKDHYDNGDLGESDEDALLVGMTDALVSQAYHYKGNDRNNITETDYLSVNSRNASFDFRFNVIYGERDTTITNDANVRQNDDTYVTQVNSGQITQYPYVIDETFQAAHSHPQYMQLNLETDATDKISDDIVVWYTLADNPEQEDNYYRATGIDVRNNYFIYNKGNVTYTGSGDYNSLQEGNEMELKLFVNTLVASYRTGVHAPRATFKESEMITSKTIETMYLPYDPSVTVEGAGTASDGYTDDVLNVFFYTSNVDLQQSSDPITALYYVQGDNADHTVAINQTGTPDYYKTIQPVKLIEYSDDPATGRLIETEIAPDALLKNNTMYRATFDYGNLKLGRVAGVRNEYKSDLYIRLGYGGLANTGIITLSAVENISHLEIITAQLFELR